MAYFTHNPYNGRPYVTSGDGQEINGFTDPACFCDDHCPAAQAHPYQLAAKRDAARELERTAPMVARDGGMFAPLEIVLAANNAGRELNAHQRYGWAPVYGSTCVVCGTEA